MNAIPKDKRFTYADYLEWDDDTRWELIDGIPYAMSAPTWQHQGVSMELSLQFGNFLKGKPCRIFAAPFDVRLNFDTADDTVVQPDLVVICDRSKIGGTGCAGVPDLVVEILSPSTSKHDKLLKFNTYQRAGVREFWLVDPDSKTLAVNILKNGEYIARAYGDTDTVPVAVLDGCEVNMADVFAVL